MIAFIDIRKTLLFRMVESEGTKKMCIRDRSMICVPVVDEFDPVDEREFFKNIIFSVSFAANENGDYVARILAYLNSVELFQLQDFKKMLEGLMSEQPAVGMQNVQPAMGAPYMQNNPYQQTPAGAPAQPQMNMKPAVMQQPVPPVQPQNLSLIHI